MDMDLDTAVDAIDCGWREKLVRGSIDRSILPEYVGTRLLVARSAQKMSKKKKNHVDVCESLYGLCPGMTNDRHDRQPARRMELARLCAAKCIALSLSKPRPSPIPPLFPPLPG